MLPIGVLMRGIDFSDLAYILISKTEEKKPAPEKKSAEVEILEKILKSVKK